MKKVKNVFVLLCCLFIAHDSFSQNCPKCENLLDVMKGDPLFISYISISSSMIDIYKSNSKASTYNSVLDSIVMSDITMSLSEKYNALDYKGAKLLELLHEQLIVMHGQLEFKYSEFAILTESEQDIFNELAIRYYTSLKN